MRRPMRFAVLTALTVGAMLASKPLHAQQATEKRGRGTFQAQRAGWMLGMYVGEERGQPYPFVLQLDEKGEARKRGVRTGDEIIRFQDEETRSLPELYERVKRLKAGREVKIWLRRGSQTLPVELVVPRNPTAAPASPDEAAEQEERKKAEAGEAEDKGKRRKRRPPIVVRPIPADQ
jgi:S1-C subfamily serine protease